MVESLRVLIVDDQARARQSLKALLASRFNSTEFMEASDGRAAIRSIGASNPGVVLMDVLMPEMDGLQATRIVKAMWPRVKVIVVSLYSEYRRDAQLAGADAFFGKGEPPEQLLDLLAAMASSSASPIA